MTKGCYTCRRRRIVCDNGQPTCRKCRDAGKECLGYQKPLVWVKGGVASRGKMMGRSFDDVNKPARGARSKPSDPARPAPISGLGFFALAESSSEAESTTPEANTWAGEPASATSNDDASLPFNELEPGNQMVHLPRGTPAEYVPAPLSLVDPLLKDLSQEARFYLFHCKIRFMSHHVGRTR